MWSHKIDGSKGLCVIKDTFLLKVDGETIC